MKEYKEIPVKSLDLTTFEMIERLISICEMSEYINNNITKAVKILNQPEEGCLSVDYKEWLYYVQRVSIDRYAWYEVVSDQLELIDAITTLACLYSYMPAVDNIGTGFN